MKRRGPGSDLCWTYCYAGAGWGLSRQLAIQLELQGVVDDRFAPVAAAFMDGFAAGRDTGAALGVCVGGNLVVDLWAGHSDRRRQTPWQRDTLCCMFSTTKAISALCILQAVARSELQLDEPVAELWPEFAVAGKESVTLRHILSHRAGLVGLRAPVERELLYDPQGFAALLAREAPWWEPGTRHGYHARTFGFLLDELLRRASGRSIAQWLAQEITDGRRLPVSIGVDSAGLKLCADIAPARMSAGAAMPESARRMMADFRDPTTPTGAAFQNPAMGPGYMNSEQFRKAELPAMNGHGTARAVAQLLDGISALLPSELIDEATSTHSFGVDEVLKSTTHFGLGFMLHCDETPIGVRDGSFGHAGAGGSMAFVDPELQLSFCFLMNQMEQGVITGGKSARNCAEAVYSCL